MMESETTPLYQGDDDDDDKFMKIFCNHLIFEKIAVNLSFRSLMVLRSTNSYINKAVIEYKPVLEAAVLVLNDGVMNPDLIENFKTFADNNTFPWKNISIDSQLVYSQFPQISESLFKLFQNVTGLAFGTKYCPEMKAENCLAKLILSTQKLVSISFDIHLLAEEEDIAQMFTEEVRSQFSTLSSITITRISKEDLNSIKHCEYGEVFKKNVYILLISTSQLKSFHFSKSSVGGFSPALYNPYVSLSDLAFPVMLKLLNDTKQAQNLVTLKAEADLLLNKTNLGENPPVQPYFPSLKNLNLTFNHRLLLHSSNFIKNHPYLTTLQLKILRTVKITKPLYEALKVLGESLEHLSLIWRHESSDDEDSNLSDDDEDDEAEPFQWSYDFLQNFKRLKVLKITETCRRNNFNQVYNSSEMFTYGHNTSFSDFLPCILPDKLHELSLCGFSNEGTKEIDGTISYPFQIYLAQFNYYKLSTLNLLKIKNSLSDSSLHFIYDHFTNLKSLKFSHCIDVTDIGITGMNGEHKVGKNLRCLTGLNSITIVFCHNISLEALMENIAFIELKDLCILQPMSEDQELYAKTLLKNNPSLEKVTYLHDHSNFPQAPYNDVPFNELKSFNGNHGVFRCFEPKDPLKYYFDDFEDAGDGSSEEEVDFESVSGGGNDFDFNDDFYDNYGGTDDDYDDPDYEEDSDDN